MAAIARAAVVLAAIALARWLVHRDRGLTWGVEFGGHIAPLHRAPDDDDDDDDDALDGWRRGMDGHP